MSDFTFAVEGGHSVRLKTAGKYCPQDIVVTAKGSADSFYDQFWDAYQQNGNRTEYGRLFTRAWTDEILQPKYKIKPQKADNMFYEGGVVNALANAEWLDLSKSTSASSFARFSSIQECSLYIPVCATLQQAFENCISLTKLRLTGISETCVFTGCFNYCRGLTELTLGGTVGQSIDLHWSPLSKDSILSCFSVLSDTATGNTASFQKKAVNAAFSTDEWNALVASKPNWTITLA